MIWGRRRFLVVGGGGLAALATPRLPRAAEVEVIDQLEVIEMKGTSRGEHVWFAPAGLAVAPGTTLHFVNRDPGNAHTATAYDPSLLDRQKRIPDAATAFDSDYLLPDEAFEVTLTVPGVYDYYCQPHEHAGMVGRIVVGRPTDAGWQGAADPSDDLPEVALAAFPSVEEILAKGRVPSKEAS